VTFRDLIEEDLPAAAALLGDGLRDNPIHVRVFGENADARQVSLTRLFQAALGRLQTQGSIEGAFEDGRLVALCGQMPPGGCRIGFIQQMRFLPSLLSVTSLSTVLRIFSWAGAWGKEDPSTPHWHLGPVGVLRSHQGKGIGSALLGAFCARMDLARSAAYLETDKEVNVNFYGKAGFKVLQRKDILGVPCWFMSRAV
jgi:ribosomal protein S18 acetylase RimI-like enzyme